ncbi:MAG TPA: FAD-dependent oxidoreductase [Rubrivivax sp.]|nr:FAD-dependent oxidoreductase [Rubrivivax sp.]
MQHDFAIVGAGIAGSTLAARLAAHGSVLLLEREEAPGLHSTGRSAAMFMESYGPPQARALTRASRAEVAPAVLSPRGVLYVAWQGQEALLAAQLAALHATGTAVQRIDARAALDRVPALRPAGLIGAIAEPEAMDIDVHALHQLALRRARTLGATLWTRAEVESAQAGGTGWTLAVSGGRSVRARVLVNAAGAWADTVAQRAGLAPLGLQPRRRSAFTFDAPGHDHRAWPAVVGIDEGWYFKPDAGQLLGSPANADPVPAHDVVAEEIDIATGIARIEERTTLSIRRPRRTWAGLRTFAPDGELVIGADPRAPGFFWLAGQGGYGIQSAAGAALLAESLLLGAPLPQDLHCQGLQPARLSPARLL